MPWIPYLPVRLIRGEKHCKECNGKGVIRNRFGSSISDSDFGTCHICHGTGKERLKQQIIDNERTKI